MNRHQFERFCIVALLATIAVVLDPRSAFAHTGVGPAHDLLHGLAHPLTGVDHILAMFAVGVWAAQRGGRALWLIPFTFIAIMTLSAALGMSGASLPFVEQTIVVSVVVLGIFVAAAIRLPLPVSVCIAGLFAVFHGYVHGAEIPATASALTYTFGFIVATILLQATGISFGLASKRMHASQLVRYAGAAIAVSGLFLCIR